MAIQADIRIYGITELSQAAQACEWCTWLGGSTRCSFFDTSDIHISMWHHKRFMIALWCLADDCLAISAIAGKRHLRSARRGLLPVPRTTTGTLKTREWKSRESEKYGKRRFKKGTPKRWTHEPMSRLIECRLFDEQTMSHTVSANEKGSYSMSPRSRGSLVVLGGTTDCPPW